MMTPEADHKSWERWWARTPSWHPVTRWLNWYARWEWRQRVGAK